jgi:DNA repair exonuclease SbcCD ATPase subunit
MGKRTRLDDLRQIDQQIRELVQQEFDLEDRLIERRVDRQIRSALNATRAKIQELEARLDALTEPSRRAQTWKDAVALAIAANQWAPRDKDGRLEGLSSPCQAERANAALLEAVLTLGRQLQPDDDVLLFDAGRKLAKRQ